MKGDVVWRGEARAITPVHVGSGESWTKDHYVIRDGHLCVFDPARVVLRMDATRRREFERAVDAGRLDGALRIVEDALRGEDILARIPLAEDSRKELEEARGNPNRWGEVTPFVRTGGRPFVPGSSIKGAIRTALLSYVVSQNVDEARRHAFRRDEQRHERPDPDALQSWALRYDPDRTEQDPFRFVQVADSVLPEGATRIRRVLNWHPERSANAKVQMHHECLVCRFDGVSLWFPLEIRIDTGRLEQARRLLEQRPEGGSRPVSDFPLDADQLRRAVNSFYLGRYRWERDRFFGPWARLLDSAFRTKIDGAELDLERLVERSDFLLLRLGRFTQFESKSVDHLRRGFQPRAKQAVSGGSTRNVVMQPFRTQTGGRAERPIPLGWVLVWLKEVKRE